MVDDRGPISITKILESEQFQDAINNCREFRDRIYTPLATLIIFIKQVLNPDKSCKKAVADFIATLLIQGSVIAPSSNTGPYTKARQRLPEGTVKELVKLTGSSVSNNSSNEWKVYGREVKAFDGSTVKMADTKANQERFPQHSNQSIGAGFPIARLLVIISLTVGSVIDYAVDAYKGKGTGEQSLLRRVLESINENDIVLGDRYFPSFFVLADLQNIGADGIFRGQSQRHYDFRKGDSLGKKDHIVDWPKPAKPNWMDQESYDLYPESIRVREFKVDGNVYVTTFIDAKKYHKRELANIYKLRWHIEISLDSIKTIMGMDMLSCKSPDMVLKEIGVHFLAYNIIRTIIAEACQRHSLSPRSVSFKGTIQLLNSFLPHLISQSCEENERSYAKMLSLIVKNKIGNRPGRVEPRMVKQRGKPFKPLNNPRHVEIDRLKNKIEKRAAKYAVA